MVAKKGVSFADSTIYILPNISIMRSIHAGSDQSTWSVMGGVPSFV